MTDRSTAAPPLTEIALVSWLGVAALACLVAMIGVTALSGVSQEEFERVRAPAEYAAALRDGGGWVRAVFAIDGAFLVIYTVFFAGLARVLATEATRRWFALGLGCLIATAVLDMIEDHHVLAMLASALRGAAPSLGQLELQQTLSAVKFHLLYLGLFAFGLGIPRATALGRALALVLTVGMLGFGAALFAAPASWWFALDLARWLGFAAGFGLALGFLRQSAR